MASRTRSIESPVPALAVMAFDALASLGGLAAHIFGLQVYSWEGEQEPLKWRQTAVAATAATHKQAVVEVLCGMRIFLPVHSHLYAAVGYVSALD